MFVWVFANQLHCSQDHENDCEKASDSYAVVEVPKERAVGEKEVCDSQSNHVDSVASVNRSYG